MFQTESLSVDQMLITCRICSVLSIWYWGIFEGGSNEPQVSIDKTKVSVFDVLSSLWIFLFSLLLMRTPRYLLRVSVFHPWVCHYGVLDLVLLLYSLHGILIKEISYASLQSIFQERRGLFWICGVEKFFLYYWTAICRNRRHICHCLLVIFLPMILHIECFVSFSTDTMVFLQLLTSHLVRDTDLSYMVLDSNNLS